jgi:hypothetical protein
MQNPATFRRRLAAQRHRCRRSTGAARPAFLRALLAVVILPGLAGCAVATNLTGGYGKAYDGPERPDSEVARLISNPDLFAAFSGDQAGTTIETVDGTDPARYSLAYYRNVKLLPGTHQIKALCVIVGYKAEPQLTARFEAGRRYEVDCLRSGSAGYLQIRDITGQSAALRDVVPAPNGLG